MIYRLDTFSESAVNPVTGKAYDASWRIFVLTDSPYECVCGSRDGCAYTIKVSRSAHPCWTLAAGDFMDFCKINQFHAIVVMTEQELHAAQEAYCGHSCRDPFLRSNEPPVLIHSTSLESWRQIQQDGMLKSWNRLKAERAVAEDAPIGALLGDPQDFSDYIMFGSGCTGEIVVSSRQKGRIVCDTDAEYHPGARLYLDAVRIARDGLLVRDGHHLKVKDQLPLQTYLLWSCTSITLGIANVSCTPEQFSRQADRQFEVASHYDALIDMDNDPVKDPDPLRRYMERWDGDAFWQALALEARHHVLEIGVGTGRLALHAAAQCRLFEGVDLSPKTIERASRHLSGFSNVTLHCTDFLAFHPEAPFDVIYSSLTLMHFEDKQAFIHHAASLLAPTGRIVLSLDKSQEAWLDIGTRRLRVYPDDPRHIRCCMEAAGLTVTAHTQTEAAHILTAQLLNGKN